MHLHKPACQHPLSVCSCDVVLIRGDNYRVPSVEAQQLRAEVERLRHALTIQEDTTLSVEYKRRIRLDALTNAR